VHAGNRLAALTDRLGSSQDSELNRPKLARFRGR
jgi:hypothetical protein